MFKHSHRQHRHPRGFTLLEVLLVIAIIAILAAIVIIAINPGKQLADARNAQRRTDVNTLLNAVYQYSVDNSGSLPAGIPQVPPGSPDDVCTTTGLPCSTGGFVDLGVLFSTQTYLTAIPEDPQCATADSSCYTIARSANGRVTVAAPLAEQGASITVTR